MIISRDLVIISRDLVIFSRDLVIFSREDLVSLFDITKIFFLTEQSLDINWHIVSYHHYTCIDIRM